MLSIPHYTRHNTDNTDLPNKAPDIQLIYWDEDEVDQRSLPYEYLDEKTSTTLIGLKIKVPKGKMSVLITIQGDNGVLGTGSNETDVTWLGLHTGLAEDRWGVRVGEHITVEDPRIVHSRYLTSEEVEVNGKHMAPSQLAFASFFYSSVWTVNVDSYMWVLVPIYRHDSSFNYCRSYKDYSFQTLILGTLLVEFDSRINDVFRNRAIAMSGALDMGGSKTPGSPMTIVEVGDEQPERANQPPPPSEPGTSSNAPPPVYYENRSDDDDELFPKVNEAPSNPEYLLGRRVLGELPTDVQRKSKFTPLDFRGETGDYERDYAQKENWDPAHLPSEMSTVEDYARAHNWSGHHLRDAQEQTQNRRDSKFRDPPEKRKKKPWYSRV